MNKSAKEYLFTSESVSEGHPDKVADQISDAILDAILEQDPTARVAAETLCTTGTVMLAGEISTTANVDYTKIVRDTLKRIGYDDSSYGIDHKAAPSWLLMTNSLPTSHRASIKLRTIRLKKAPVTRV